MHECYQPVKWKFHKSRNLSEDGYTMAQTMWKFKVMYLFPSENPLNCY